MSKKNIVFIVITVFIIGTALSLSLIKSSRNKITYKTEPVRRGDIEVIVATTGTLEPVSMVNVGSQVSGEITKLYADFNSPVKKGQVLAELDRAPFEDEVKQSEANYHLAQSGLDKAQVTLENAKSEYDRTLDLFEKNMVSVEDKDAAEEAYLIANDDVRIAQEGLKEAKAELDSRRVNLSNTLIRSPIDGVVVSRDVNVGQTVAASFQAPELFKIANDLSKMRVECDVDEEVVGNVKEGQKVWFSVESFPEETFTGRVIQIRAGADTDQDVVTYTTVVEVDNPDTRLMPGMTATVSIITAVAKNVLKVPNVALKFAPPSLPRQMMKLTKNFGLNQGTDRNASLVWLQGHDRKLTSLLIRTGITDGIYTEVSSGDLKEGETIVTGIKSSAPKFEKLPLWSLRG